VCSALAVYAHFFAGLILFAQAASLPFLRSAERPSRHLAISGVVITLLLVPAGLLAATGPSGQLSWLARPGIKAVFSQPVNLAGGPALSLVFLALLAVAAVAARRAWKADGRSPDLWRVALMFAWLLVPYSVSLAYSVFVAPAYLDRFLLVSLPALSLGVALGLHQLRTTWAVAVTTVIVVVSLAGVVDWYGQPSRQDWRGAAKYVLERSTDTDGLVVCGDRRSFEYYVLQHDPSRAPVPLRPGGPWKVGFHSFSDVVHRPLPARVWLVSERGDVDRQRCVRRSNVGERARSIGATFSGLHADAYDE
jgi:hypothetical protein